MGWYAIKHQLTKKKKKQKKKTKQNKTKKTTTNYPTKKTNQPIFHLPLWIDNFFSFEATVVEDVLSAAKKKKKKRKEKKSIFIRQ